MKLERTDPCPCGSGRTYEKCCQAWREASALKASVKKAAPSAADCNQLAALLDAGRLAELESRARLLLEQYPDSGFVWNLLGASLQMQGKDGLPALQNAAKFLPNDAEVHSNLGNAIGDLGRYDEAEASYRRALQINPYSANAHCNLGITLGDLGRLDEAEASYRRALQIKPDIAEAHNSLGNILRKLGRLDEAEASYRRALQIKPDIAEVHISLGNTLSDLGRPDEAEASYRRALEIKPDFAGAYYNLGATLHNLNRLDEAAASFRRALEIKPDYVEAHSNLGATLYSQGRLDEAEASCRRALQINPDNAEAHNNLGNILQDMGQFDGAVASYRRALEVKPDFAEAHYNLGNALSNSRLEEAEACYRRAIQINPGHAEAHNNLGNILRNLGRLDEAEASYRQALNAKPGLVDAYDNILYLHAFTRDITPELECSLAASWENIALDESGRIAARNRVLSFAHLPRAGRKLRVGVVSAELGQHPVAEFLEPFLDQLDRSRFHITLYPTAVRLEPRAARFRELADEYKPLVGTPDSKAADLIRSDQIDILVDTTGHMKGSRLGIFARRAAPVQCHYIGYHGTTGLTEMDWFIADEVLLPPACDAHFRENIWRLPRLRMSYRGDISLPGSNWKPDPGGVIWLGSFNNLTKVREEALGLWARVMNALPESRLLLKDRKATDRPVQQRIRMELARYGINGGRVEFVGHVPDWNSHMALYDRLDIALDTIPLNSETTAFDALWMGVPLVALEGNWMGGRMSSTILKSLGKPEWVARSEDEYVALVAALAKDVEGRKSLRAAQRALMADSPLCDAKGLTRVLEDAFEKMFDLWMENARASATANWGSATH